ncbi:MAG: radical SAM protein [Anaerocolumna sp.]
MLCNNLYIMLNRACSGVCEICCTESDPKCKERLNYESVKKFILSTSRDKELKKITFTGGEPFVYYEDLKQYIAYTKEIGKNAVCYTNGFWAASYEEAYTKLVELKKSGLKELIVSFDYYHNKHIKAGNIRNIFQAAEKIGIAYYLSMIKTKKHSIGDIINRLDEDISDSSVLVNPCLPVGNAKIYLKEEDFIRNLIPENLSCYVKHRILLKYDGTILPCISPAMLNAGIRIGNYENMDFPEAKQIIEKDCLLNVIRNQGFDNLIDIAKNEFGIKIPEKIISTCELCAILFNRENADKFYDSIKETDTGLLTNIS